MEKICQGAAFSEHKHPGKCLGYKFNFALKAGESFSKSDV